MSDDDCVPVFGPTRCASLNEAGELEWTEGQMYLHRFVAEAFTGHMQQLYPEVGTVAPDDGQPYETPDGGM
jgi:hypothetical protein